MFITPEETISYFGIAEGMKIADLGCGTGSYTIPMAFRIRGAGKVYAIEVQKELLERLTRDARAKHLTNIETIWGTIEHVGGTKLADQSIDVALLSNVLFQVEDRVGCMKELMRIVKHDGHVVVIVWSVSIISRRLVVVWVSRSVVSWITLYSLSRFFVGSFLFLSLVKTSQTLLSHGIVEVFFLFVNRFNCKVF